MQGAHPTSAGGVTTIMPTQDGMLITNENDLDILVTFEEELSRQGHFSVIFPLKSNIDTYRPFFN